MYKSDTNDGEHDHTPEVEAEVNEPLELDKYMYCGAWQYTLHDPVTHRTVRINPEAFVDVEEWR